jgi:hypothetical protein
VSAQLRSRKGRARTSSFTTHAPTRPRFLIDQLVYGPPLVPAPLTYAPTTEAGVIFLFGTLAKELGFAVTHIQNEFPDCEAMRQVEPERWQRAKIEFEYESRNFQKHLHPVDRCDLIVCWSHNWEECPLEVLELKAVVNQEKLPQIKGDDR